MQTHSVEITDVEKLLVAKKLFNLWYKEADVRRLYTATVGQKLYSLCRLDAEYPMVGIIYRCCLPPDDPKHVSLHKLRGADLLKLWQQSDAQNKRNNNAPTLTDRERNLPPITVADVERYFNTYRR